MMSFEAKEISYRLESSILIQGQVDCIGFLIPEPEEEDKYIQICFLHSQESIRIRMRILRNDGIQRNIVESLEVLRQSNQYIIALRHMMEVIRTFSKATIEMAPDRRPAQEHERDLIIKLQMKSVWLLKIIMGNSCHQLREHRWKVIWLFKKKLYFNMGSCM